MYKAAETNYEKRLVNKLQKARTSITRQNVNYDIPKRDGKMLPIISLLHLNAILAAQRKDRYSNPVMK